MSQGGDWAWIVGAGSVALMVAGCAGMVGVGLMRGVDLPELDDPTVVEVTAPLEPPAPEPPVEETRPPAATDLDPNPERVLKVGQGVEPAVEILSAAYGQGLVMPDAQLSVRLDSLCAQGIAGSCNQPRGLQGAAESTLTVRCEQQDALACLVLGWKLTQRDKRGRPHLDRHELKWVSVSDIDVEDTPRDIQGADAFHMGCKQGEPRSCAELGRLYGWGIGRAHDPARAAELFQVACEAGDGLACSWWGDAVGDADPERALELYTRSCREGSGEGCRNQYGLTEDQAAGDEVLSQGCLGLGDGRACTWMSQNQVERETDPDAGIARLELICDGASAQVGLPFACDLLAGYALNGLGMPSNATWAVELNRKGCEGGDPEACAHLAYRYDDGRGVTADPRQSLRYLRLACDAGFAEGCRELAEMRYSSELDDPPAPDNTEALAAMERACALGDGEGCNRLAIVYTKGAKGAPEKTERVGELHEQACELDFAWGCFNQAWWDDKADKGTEPWAAERLLKSCEMGLGEGCEAYAKRLEEGRGVAPDPTGAAEYRAKACEMGVESACGG